MAVCLPKEKTFDPIQPPIFAFEIFLETRGRHLSCQAQHKRFYLFIVYFLRPIVKLRMECARRGEVLLTTVCTCMVCCCDAGDVSSYKIFLRLLLHSVFSDALTRGVRKNTTPKTHLPLRHFFRPCTGRRPYITSFILAKKPEENPISRPFFRPTKF